MREGRAEKTCEQNPEEGLRVGREQEQRYWGRGWSGTQETQ